MVNAALAFQSSTSSAVDIAVVAIGVTLSVIVAAALLTRQRSRVKLDDAPDQPAPKLLSGRQRKVMEKLEPVPELPTLMDLVREEIAEAGVLEIPGHEGLPEHVILKVFRRDQAVINACTHDDVRFVLRDGVEGGDALEADVKLLCEECGPLSAETGDVERIVEEPGTDIEG